MPSPAAGPAPALLCAITRQLQVFADDRRPTADDDSPSPDHQITKSPDSSRWATRQPRQRRQKVAPGVSPGKGTLTNPHAIARCRPRPPCLLRHHAQVSRTTRPAVLPLILRDHASIRQSGKSSDEHGRSSFGGNYLHQPRQFQK